MANGVVVQFALLSALAAIVMGLFIVYRRGKAQREPSHKVPRVRAVVEKSESMQPKPMPIVALQKPPEAERQVTRMITREASTNEANSAVNRSLNAAAPKPPVVLQAQPATIQGDGNQRILAGISENIRKSLIKPVPTYSPIQYPETPRDTEYIRIKKQIITPHGQVRFSILKESLSTNMLAVFRRASMDWKTPDDLIGFLPSYLEAEAEILNDQVLLISTPGHNEKLAIPIRRVDPESSFRDCFDFVTDVRTATNTPAVLVASDSKFEVVSKGVITQPVFKSGVERVHAEVKFLERDHTKVKLLVEKSPEALLKN